MLHRRVVVVAGLLLVTACERPTAPAARDLAGRLAKEFERGSPTIDDWWVYIHRAYHASNLVDTTHQFEIRRDGNAETMQAFVVENAFVPPGKLGRPRERRTIIAWPKSRSFYIVGTAELHPSTIAKKRYGFDEGNDWFRPAGFLALTHAKRGPGWVSREGTLEIGDAAPMGDCPLDFRRWDGPGAGDRERVTCEQVMYRVMLNAEFVLESDAELPIPEAMKPRHRLEMPPQVVPGIRFTTYCLDESSEGRRDLAYNYCLSNHLHFWRDSDLFEDSLGVDVTQMSSRDPKRPPNGDFLYPYRVIQKGEHNRDAAWWGASWMCRWTFRAPDGRLLERDSAYQIDRETGGKWRQERFPTRYEDFRNGVWTYPVAWKGHNQYLVPERVLNRDASWFSVLVLDYSCGPPD